MSKLEGGVGENMEGDVERRWSSQPKDDSLAGQSGAQKGCTKVSGYSSTTFSARTLDRQAIKPQTCKFSLRLTVPMSSSAITI